MKYKLTALSPLLVGDGRRLAPIDYMVWKDQVNVLDQRRIFKLLAKGPRLEGYLNQLKKAEKLDFASWGGFAQNFADRRVPFEHPSAAKYWEASHGDTLHIPTFVAGAAGPYLPGSAVKGALRTGMLFTRWHSGAKPNLERLTGERLPRRPGEESEQQAVGSPSVSFMKAVAVADSAPIAVSTLRLYLLRVSTLQPKRAGGGFDLGWKQVTRGTASKPEDGAPQFAEMAEPGTVFEGNWRENAFYAQPEIVRALRWREPVTGARLFAAANEYAARLLAIHRQYAEWTGLTVLARNLDAIQAQLDEAKAAGNACIVSLGWGGGFLAKTGWLETDEQAYRSLLKQIPLYARAAESGLPFPKTRRIVFLENQPATLPGWARLEIG